MKAYKTSGGRLCIDTDRQTFWTDLIRGAGMALDPLPPPYGYHTFHKSSVRAFTSNLHALVITRNEVIHGLSLHHSIEPLKSASVDLNHGKEYRPIAKVG